MGKHTKFLSSMLAHVLSLFHLVLALTFQPSRAGLVCWTWDLRTAKMGRFRSPYLSFSGLLCVHEAKKAMT